MNRTSATAGPVPRVSAVRTSSSTLHRRIVHWYRHNGRNLPWRRTNNAYRILVSEIMLQQTQVSRVMVKYPEFLKQFPTIRSLSRASRAEVIRAWQGMGYNNRAVRLHTLARMVVSQSNGSIPHTVDGLMALPGIGRYTASAISCFAFKQPVAVVDVNIARVLSRLCPSSTDPWKTAWRLLPRNNAYEWNQALMDLGALICTATSPACERCPVSTLCRSAFRARNVKRANKSEPHRDGIPNRIYRGRIVEALRRLNGKRTVTAQEIAQIIKPGFRATDRQWFQRLVNDLERDGLVSTRRHNGRMRLSLAE